MRLRLEVPKMPLTLISPSQINLRQLLSVERVLAARGLKVASHDSKSTTLLATEDRGADFEDLFYAKFSNSNVRFELLNISEGKLSITEAKYSMEIVENVILDRQRFSSTIEWYIGEMLVREFHSFSFAFGVKVAGLSDGDIGDYDVLSVMGDTSLLYIECKSGSTDLEQIRKVVRRGRLIASAATVIALDKKSGTLSKLTKILADHLHPELGLKVQVFGLSAIGLQNSQIFVWGNTYFLPLTSESLENSTRTLLRLIGQQKAGNYNYSIVCSAPFDNGTESMFSSMGFKFTETEE